MKRQTNFSRAPKARGNGDCGWISLLYLLEELNHPIIRAIFKDGITASYAFGESEVYFEEEIINQFKAWFYEQWLNDTTKMLDKDKSEHSDFDQCLIENAIELVTQFKTRDPQSSTSSESGKTDIQQLISQAQLNTDDQGEIEKIHDKAILDLDKQEWISATIDIDRMINLNSLSDEQLECLFHETDEEIKIKLRTLLNAIGETRDRSASDKQIDLAAEDIEIIKSPVFCTYYKDLLLDKDNPYWCTTQELRILAHLLGCEIYLVNEHNTFICKTNEIHPDTLLIEHNSNPGHYNPIRAHTGPAIKKRRRQIAPPLGAIEESDGETADMDADRTVERTADAATNTDALVNEEDTGMKLANNANQAPSLAEDMDIPASDQENLTGTPPESIDIQESTELNQEEQRISEEYIWLSQELENAYPDINNNVLHSLVSWIMTMNEKKDLTIEKRNYTYTYQRAMIHLMITGSPRETSMYIESVKMTGNTIHFQCQEYDHYSCITQDKMKRYCLAINTINYQLSFHDDNGELLSQSIDILSISTPQAQQYKLIPTNIVDEIEKHLPSIEKKMVNFFEYFHPFLINCIVEEGNSLYTNDKLNVPQAERMIQTAIWINVKLTLWDNLRQEPGGIYKMLLRIFLRIPVAHPPRDGKTSLILAAYQASQLSKISPVALRLFRLTGKLPLSCMDEALLYQTNEGEINARIKETIDLLMKKMNIQRIINVIHDTSKTQQYNTHGLKIISCTDNCRRKDLSEERNKHPIFKDCSTTMESFFKEHEIGHLETSINETYVAINKDEKIRPKKRSIKSLLVKCLNKNGEKVYISFETGIAINPNEFTLFKQCRKAIVLDEFTELDNHLIKLLSNMMEVGVGQLYLVEAHKQLTGAMLLRTLPQEIQTKLHFYGRMANNLQPHLDNTKPIKHITYSSSDPTEGDFRKWLFGIHRWQYELRREDYYKVKERQQRIIEELSKDDDAAVILRKKTEKSHGMIHYASFVYKMRKKLADEEYQDIFYREEELTDEYSIADQAYALHNKIYKRLGHRKNKLQCNNVPLALQAYFHACVLCCQGQTTGFVGLQTRSKDEEIHSMSLAKWMIAYQLLRKHHKDYTQDKTKIGYTGDKEDQVPLFYLPPSVLTWILQQAFDMRCENKDIRLDKPILNGEKYPSNARAYKGRTLVNIKSRTIDETPCGTPPEFEGNLHIVIDTRLPQSLGTEHMLQILARTHGSGKEMVLVFPRYEGPFSFMKITESSRQLLGIGRKFPYNMVCNFSPGLKHPTTKMRMTYLPEYFLAETFSSYPEKIDVLEWMISKCYIERISCSSMRENKKPSEWVDIGGKHYPHTYQINKEKITGPIEPNSYPLFSVKQMILLDIKNKCDDDALYETIKRVFENYIDYLNSINHFSIQPDTLDCFLKSILGTRTMGNIIPQLEIYTQNALRSFIKENFTTGNIIFNKCFDAMFNVKFNQADNAIELFNQFIRSMATFQTSTRHTMDGARIFTLSAIEIQNHQAINSVLDKVLCALNQEKTKEAFIKYLKFYIEMKETITTIVSTNYINSLKENGLLRYNTYNDCWQLTKPINYSKSQYTQSSLVIENKANEIKTKFIKGNKFGNEPGSESLFKALEELPKKCFKGLTDACIYSYIVQREKKTDSHLSQNKL